MAGRRQCCAAPASGAAQDGRGDAVSDVKVERKESVSREDAASWLELVARAFAEGSDVELPFGGGDLSLRVPDQVHAEFEIEVDGTDVEVELEFKWSTARPAAGTPK